MKTASPLLSSIQYGENLLERGLSGLRTGSEAYLQGEPLPSFLRVSVRNCVPLALLGAVGSFVPILLATRRQERKRVALLAIAGSGLCFLTGFAWRTRKLVASMNNSARKQVQDARDEHWLAEHPIDYA